MNIKVQKYAELVIKKGLGVIPGQPVLISAPIEGADFVKLLVEEAYKAGSNRVEVDWIDDDLNRLKFTHEPMENFKTTADYQVARMDYHVNNNYALLKISATDPEALNGINPDKIMELQKTNNRDLKRKTSALMNDKMSWCVISIPTLKWAEKVFPDSEDPVKELWDAILEMTRCNTLNPIAEWEKHIKNLDKYATSLNDYQFSKLKFTNSVGTNLEVGLPHNHIWQSAESRNKVRNIPFVANMPSEEVFTMPHKDQVNGIVYSSKPLNYQGNLIDKFSVEFKDGRAIKVNAEQGQEVLEKLIAVDDGAALLGEVALVSYESPISLSNILFYNTLFDENASCHLAFGKAYPTCINDSAGKTISELQNLGVNDSAIHVDFMFGTDDLEVEGVLKDGTVIPVFKKGNFVEVKQVKQVS